MAPSSHPPSPTPSPKASSGIFISVLWLTFLFVGAAVWRQIRSALPPAHAAQDSDGHYTSWPCAPDAAQLCPNVPRGGGRVNACLRQHNSELSLDCIDYLEYVDPSNDWSNVCREELHTFCAGRGHSMRCLYENRARLTPRCAALLTSYDTSRQWQGACGDDAQRLCAQVAPDQRAAVESCLNAHATELSFSCRFYLNAKKGNL